MVESLEGINDMNILFVCTGNTCRSPMAEALLKHKLKDVNVQSAGIYAAEGQRANTNAIEVLKEKQIELVHRSQMITDKLLEWADVILTMTTQHKRALIMQFPDYQEKYFTLKEYVSDADIEVWTELKREYAELVEKRAQFIQENQHLEQGELEKALADHLSEQTERIQQLESTLINYDISDPFGGDLQDYRTTLEELERYIDLLVNRIRKK